MKPVATLSDIQLQDGQSVPLFMQLYQEIRERILSGQWVAGTRLPASRKISQLLGVSRNTVTAAVDQLIAEGYLKSQQGAGTWVCEDLPDVYREVDGKLDTSSSKRAFSGSVSTYGQSLLRQGRRFPPGNGSFTPGVPALDLFPNDIWRRLSTRQRELRDCDLLGYSDIAGYAPLRKAVAAYLARSRAVRCTPDQVVITHGAQQALDLCARVLADPGQTVGIEDPGYVGARRAFVAAGLDVQGVPVDDQGLSVEALWQRFSAPDFRPTFLYTTPAHQYPLGAAMPLSRRMELLDWAEQVGCWMIEDDYDSEYHFNHRPIASLQGLCQHEQVIYLGSFSKTLFPALRLGYLVLPEHLVTSFTVAKNETSGESPAQTQAITADFLNEGFFDSHLKKMRVTYGERWRVMTACCEAKLVKWGRVRASQAGMHVVIELHRRINDQRLATQLRSAGIGVSPLSQYFWQEKPTSGMVLGFANSTPEQIVAGVDKIARVLSAF
ncbi:transcriptional regulator, GntR family [Oleiphilus messinensis]|uniref:Transcriptional regulator, GntR family n=1 Tax=Oleiphilus messinensis TaxID=141451 RepID=A0A1Y0IGX0_9GAMM|nr:PLP-dependent aminotransferase family protein [Oleiphilus messinensis]ARU59086.1 transcriptional regulator, GntR family [Oleiphilus messinensis]